MSRSKDNRSGRWRSGKLAWLALPLLFGGCLGVPQGVEPVTGFDLNSYLGTWYEVARLDHRFERGLERVTAEYALRKDGGLRVVNRGYSPTRKTWKEAVGRAYFVGSSEIGHLKVSFFGPFYGSYVIIELGREDGGYAYVTGPDRDYLWLLARTPKLPAARIEAFRKTASALGYDLSSLILVAHP